MSPRFILEKLEEQAHAVVLQELAEFEGMPIEEKLKLLFLVCERLVVLAATSSAEQQQFKGVVH